MEILLKQVKDALYHLDEIQANHIGAFETQILPDLEKQMMERKEGFYELKMNLTAFFQKMALINIDGEKPMAQDTKEHIQLLMHQNKVLTTLVETHKTQLENSMKNIAKGRQTIHAYGSLTSQNNHPKVLSFRK